MMYSSGDVLCINMWVSKTMNAENNTAPVTAYAISSNSLWKKTWNWNMKKITRKIWVIWMTFWYLSALQHTVLLHPMFFLLDELYIMYQHVSIIDDAIFLRTTIMQLFTWNPILLWQKILLPFSVELGMSEQSFVIEKCMSSGATLKLFNRKQACYWCHHGGN